MIKKSLSLLLAVIMISMAFTAIPITVDAAAVDAAATEEGTVKYVGTADELKAACNEINTNGGNYTINLTDDIEGYQVSITKSDAVVTVIGNGHTVSSSESAVYIANGATVNLGDGESALTLTSANNNDVAGIVDIQYDSFCNMYDKVTLKDHKGDNYFGGGVTVKGGTFHMYGGTIENCGIDSGSVCYGGGVAVIAGGSFIMDNGTITKCYVRSDYTDEYDPNRCFTAMGGGVFVTAGSSFTMNGGTISNCEATNMGGGIAMASSDSMSDQDEWDLYKMGNPKSNVTINNGTISGNKAWLGAGIFVSGYFYAFSSAFEMYPQGTGLTDNPGLYINGGTIEQNEAEDMGGGILVAMIKSAAKIQIYNAFISSNKADNGAGIESFGYWTQMDIDGCTITDNSAVTKGGGIMLSTNGSGGYTNLKKTTVTDNTSGDRGAGVYYDKNSALHISGADVIQNNKFNGALNNLNILSVDKPVYVDGDLSGSKIGLSDPSLWDDGMSDIEAPDDGAAELLTNGYKEHNPEVHPSEYFTSDHETWIVERTEKTTTTTPDPDSKTYREYKVKRHPLNSSANPKAFAGHRYQYVITDIQNPELTNISTANEIISELKYRLESTNKYNKTDSSNASVGSTYIRYTPKDSSVSVASIVLQKAPNTNEVTLTYNANRTIRPYLGSVTFTATTNSQSRYANSRELVLQITSNGDTYLNNPASYDFVFSDDYTESTINYVNLDPPDNVLYEYDEYGDVAAKLEIVSYEPKQAQISVETGTDDEVRLVRKKPDYHINNTEIDDHYNNNDIFTSYVEAATKEIKVGETIEEFYTVPEVIPTETNSCPYIFKGWYYDKENDNDSHPVQFGTDKYAKDIYAHWIKVENVAKDEKDTYAPPKSYNGIYGGFDLPGVQIRKEMRDYNFDNVPKTPGGLRFITSLNMDVVKQINAIKPNNIEYGYVAATHEQWIEYHRKALNGDEKLQYVSKTANGIDTSSANASNENYYGFAKNVNCTSKVANRQNGVVNLDHQNFDQYLLYSLVITYEGEDAAGKDTNVLARPYIKYTDANGLERVAYSDYRGTNVIGGCYTNYNAIAEMAGI